jgi:hypothetical protein
VEVIGKDVHVASERDELKVFDLRDCTLNYCCTTPLPAGTSNVAEERQLASAWRLSAGSPCLGRGSGAHVSGLDLDGEPWANPPSIGRDE